MAKTTSTPSLFIPISKVDEETRTVYGQMTAETADTSGEIWDYDGSKPYFEAWSANAEKVTGGKSLGNLRSMHQPIAAGKLTQFVMDDATKSVEIAAKVVDDAEWDKVLLGVYTGFSQGGRYVKRWKDKDDSSKTRYISDPVEVSLVDVPCLSSATFEVIRMGGASEIRKFTSIKETPMVVTNEQVAERATKMATDAGDATKWADHVVKARADLEAEAAAGAGDPEGSTEDPVVEEEDAEKAAAAKAAAAAAPEGEQTEEEIAAAAAETEKAKKAARDALVQVWQTPDGETFAKAADAVSHIMGEPALPANPIQDALDKAKGDAKKPYGDVKYADAKNGKYPIDTEKHIRAAWSYINMPKNQKDYSDAEVKSIKDKIEAAWKETIDKSGPPSAEKMARWGDVEKTVAVLLSNQDLRVEKGIYTVSTLACLLSSFASLARGVAQEAAMEGDNSPQVGQSRDILAALSTFLVDMAEEETAELLQAHDDYEPVVSPYCAPYGEWARGVTDLMKADTDLMEKAGARNSTKDKAALQAIHDNVVKMGADCGMDKSAQTDDLAKRAQTDPAIKAMLDENEVLKARQEQAVTGIGELGEEMRKMREEMATLRAQPAPLPPNGHIVGKGEENGGAAEVDVTKAASMIAELGKTPEGQRMLAESAIRLSQSSGGSSPR